jgi:hypothetical protein
MIRGLVAVGFVGLLVAGCGVLRPTVGEDKIKSDLIGQKFAYAASLFGQSIWTIEPDELKGWRLIRRVTDKDAGTDVIYAAVRLEGGKQVISGNLKIIYRFYDKGWQLDKISADSDFSISNRPQITE